MVHDPTCLDIQRKEGACIEFSGGCLSICAESDQSVCFACDTFRGGTTGRRLHIDADDSGICADVDGGVGSGGVCGSKYNLRKNQCSL